jgi:hypothetical protein
MGLLDGIKKGLKNLYEEVPDETNKANQTQQAVQPTQPLVTNANYSTRQYVDPVTTANPFAPAQTGPVISEEDKKKYQDYFSALYNAAKSKSSNYGEFLANIDTVIETDPTLPEANKFKMAFSFLKKKGITKEQLSQSCNDAINIVDSDRKTKFDVDIKSRNEAIEANNQAIILKRQQIQKLSEEITALEQETEQTKQKISIKTYLYNNFSAQLINKIKADLSGIQSFIN